jgi:bifunctional non-homologous end joining protein LigD
MLLHALSVCLQHKGCLPQPGTDTNIRPRLGVPSFDRLRYRRHDGSVFLYAFEVIEVNGDDLRREPLEVRKATLASLLRRAAPGLRLNEHIEADGPTVFAHACKMGLEGIVSKRKDSSYRSGRSSDWLKMKNPADWGR